MKPTKKLSSDYKPLEQPEGTYSFGKNGVWTINQQALQNENGFRLSLSAIPLTFIGAIETDRYPVIFSTDNTISKIGVYNTDLDIYEAILSDDVLPYKLNFKTANYIKGESRRNFKNNIEIVWKELGNSVRSMDIDSDLPTNLNDFLLFPKHLIPTINLSVVDGGILTLGAYYASVKYLNKNGSETRYTSVSQPIFVYGTEFIQNKAIKIELTNLDTRYEQFQVAIISKVKGITSAKELSITALTNSSIIIYTGNEGDAITPEEILIPAANYDNVSAITQLNDVLYLAGTKTIKLPDLQKYASLIKIKWQSSLIIDPLTNVELKSGSLKTFKHQEVYNFYIKYIIDGSPTDLFIIPGVKPLPESLDSAGGSYSADIKNYHLDTLQTSQTEETGYTGVYPSQVQTYSDLGTYNWNSIDIGGEDLTNQFVRYHKMPTLQQTREIHKNKGYQFGVNAIDVLGVYAENIIIPSEFAGRITHYELYYAKRNFSDATVISEGLAINGVKSGYTGESIHFNGGNYNSEMLPNNKTSNSTPTAIQRILYTQNNISKLHHPDLMIKRPVFFPKIIKSEYKLRANSPQLIRNTDDELNFSLDYTQQSASSSSGVSTPISDSFYLVNGQEKNKVFNVKSEDGFVVKHTPLVKTNSSAFHDGRKTVGISKAPNFEEAHYVSLISPRPAIYTEVSDFVRAGKLTSITESGLNYGGDCFIVVHSYFSYGLTNSLDIFATNPGDGSHGLTSQERDNTYTKEFYYNTSGIKVSRRYLTESSINVNLRYEDIAIPLSRFWNTDNREDVNDLDRGVDNNVFRINEEASAQADLNSLSFVKDFANITNYNPYRIIRSFKQQREDRINSWKNFNALDYFESEKTMGPIINLQGYGDKLIIHHEKAIYVTQDKTTLEADILSVTLGTGDIFRIEPQKLFPSKMGYGGTQHELACVLTDAGYIFPDVQTHDWFIYSGSELKSLSNDLSNFFEKYFNVKETNVFIGNGITAGFDRRYSRLLMTVKNKKLLGNVTFVSNYQNTPEFFSQLVPNQSVVFKDGRYQLYKGTNISAFSCPVVIMPTIDAKIISIDEYPNPIFAINTSLLATGLAPLSYLITSTPDPIPLFYMNPTSGALLVANRNLILASLNPSKVYTVQVKDKNGNTASNTLTVNLNSINISPIVQDRLFTIEEFTASNTLIADLSATDVKGLLMTYLIISQSVPNSFTINATTALFSVSTAANFDLSLVPQITAVVQATNSVGSSSTFTVTTIISAAPPAFLTSNSFFNVGNNVTGVLGLYEAPVSVNSVTVVKVNEFPLGAFIVNTSTREITKVAGFPLVIGTTYRFEMTATDTVTLQESDFNIEIFIHG